MAKISGLERRRVHSDLQGTWALSCFLEMWCSSWLVPPGSHVSSYAHVLRIDLSLSWNLGLKYCSLGWKLELWNNPTAYELNRLTFWYFISGRLFFSLSFLHFFFFLQFFLHDGYKFVHLINILGHGKNTTVNKKDKFSHGLYILAWRQCIKQRQCELNKSM